ncbi:MAG TPA: phosphomannomutase [Candidatus Saccharimonadales bacterium]|nr:phosphomannomutase [Candidatus Saccharimonadales bacterium]
MAKLRDWLEYNPVELTFGTSGLRGLVTDMTDLECYINAVGFLRFLAQAGGLQKDSLVYLAGDLRHSTPRILRAVHQAITDSGYKTLYCGLIPTPAVAYAALQKGVPCIMVTGSHIPDDRNGIKFYKATGEVLKDDEAAIREAVGAVRQQIYASETASFTQKGMLVQKPNLPPEEKLALQLYIQRYTDVFDATTFAGKKIVFYQHSAVGRDSLVAILQALGAKVVSVGRSEKFVPIDTENITPDDQAYFKVLAAQYPDAFAIVSTDGDSDRPFVIDEHGVFHRGDVLGAVVADWLQADFAALPISSSDAVDQHLTDRHVRWQHTRIGSPYVISVMEEAVRGGSKRAVGWEVNGGLLLGCNVKINGKTLKALPTRDALLPIIGALLTATQQNKPVSAIFNELPKRFTQAGLINDFPMQVSRQILQRFSLDTPEVRAELQAVFNAKQGFGALTAINTIDGIRMFFDNGDIAHLRPSGNAPQLRIYSVANTQERADQIVAMAIAEPNGIFRSLQAFVEK